MQLGARRQLNQSGIDLPQPAAGCDQGVPAVFERPAERFGEDVDGDAPDCGDDTNDLGDIGRFDIRRRVEQVVDPAKRRALRAHLER